MEMYDLAIRIREALGFGQRNVAASSRPGRLQHRLGSDIKAMFLALQAARTSFATMPPS
jgi:hypothetical protein